MPRSLLSGTHIDDRMSEDDALVCLLCYAMRVRVAYGQSQDQGHVPGERTSHSDGGKPPDATADGVGLYLGDTGKLCHGV